MVEKSSFPVINNFIVNLFCQSAGPGYSATVGGGQPVRTNQEHPVKSKLYSDFNSQHHAESNLYSDFNSQHHAQNNSYLAFVSSYPALEQDLKDS